MPVDLINMSIDKILEGKPFLSREQVIQVVQEKYDLEVQLVKTLDGYDNQNFLIEATPVSDKKDVDKKTSRYSLKVTNSELTKEYESLRDATHMMDYLQKEGFSCPQPIPNKDGKLCELVTFKNLLVKDSGGDQRSEDTFMIRMLTFLPGKTLNDLNVVPNNVYEEMGESLGRVHIALHSLKLDHKPLMDLADRFPWSLNQLCQLESSFHVVEDSKRRKMIREVLDDFQRNVHQKRSELPQGFIHGDYNDVNTLVNQSSENGETHMIGFIDFDDATYSCIVYDVGICLMYILQSKAISRDKAAASFLRGYNKHRQLNQLEKSSLYYCAAARFAQSLVFGLVNYATHKDDYVMGTQVRGWDALQEMWDRGQEITYQKWEIS